jgi:mono/diheme cytochrome c family protein
MLFETFFYSIVGWRENGSACHGHNASGSGSGGSKDSFMKKKDKRAVITLIK